MFRDIGPVTPKARLDFMDVKVQLSEERYLNRFLNGTGKEVKFMDATRRAGEKSRGIMVIISGPFAGIVPPDMIPHQGKPI